MTIMPMLLLIMSLQVERQPVGACTNEEERSEREDARQGPRNDVAPDKVGRVPAVERPQRREEGEGVAGRLVGRAGEGKVGRRVRAEGEVDEPADEDEDEGEDLRAMEKSVKGASRGARGES